MERRGWTEIPISVPPSEDTPFVQERIPLDSNRLLNLLSYPSMILFELVDKETVGIRFPYREGWIAEIKRIPDRRWNKNEQRWEVPLAYLSEVAEIFGRRMETVPIEVRSAFESVSGKKTLLGVGNTFTEIKGVDLPIASLDEGTSFWVQGAEYSKIYQDGRWDGNRHLMRKKGGLAFPTGLLPTVEKILTEAGHDYSIEDKRKKPTGRKRLQTQGHALRDYQKKALRATKKNERGVLQLATGAGKTLLAAHILADRGLNALFFVHTKDLLYQTMKVLGETLQIPIGQFGDGVVEPQTVTVATIQTTARAQNLKVTKEGADDVPAWKDEAGEDLTPTDREKILQTIKDCRVAIFDECHHLPANTFYEIAMKLTNAYYRYGLSATPWRSDRSDLMIEAALGPKLCAVTSSDLIERGFLVAPKITMYEILPTQKKIPRKYPTVYKSELVEHIERNRVIADVAEHLSGQGKTVLILVSQINHGQNLEGMIPNATFIQGRDSSEVRQKALDSLRERTSQVLIATTLADEGLDLPSLDALILAGGGRSETRALQRIGRVLRPHPGKKIATVVDFYDQTKYLEEHSKHRFKIYQTEPAFEVEIRPPRDRGPVKSRQKSLSEN